jgi:hypothetical protein
MKKALLTGIAVLLLATGTTHATEDFCAVVLKPPAKVVRDKQYNPDAWLAIRDGPGMQFMVMGKLREGDFLNASTGGVCKELNRKEICDNKREWVHVIGIPRFDGSGEKTYKDYSRGWVRSKYIQTFLCEEDQAGEGKIKLGPDGELPGTAPGG